MDEEIVDYDFVLVWERVLDEYFCVRVQDVYVINDLVLQNYVEMRVLVLSLSYWFRKWLEEQLSVWLFGLGWQMKYLRVSFGNERYSEVVRKSEYQGRVLMRVLMGLLFGVLGGLLVVVGVVMVVWYWRVVDVGLRVVMGNVDSMVEYMIMNRQGDGGDEDFFVYREWEEIFEYEELDIFYCC